MLERERIETARSIMAAFKRRGRRYLWTDAFAVCNDIALNQLDDARALVDDVHATLGRHRGDDAGWLSGLSEEEGREHPTRGGLRIGKKLPERRADEPADPQLEWDRDGQYFHYLTRWMHALDRLCAATREPRFNLWARELLDVAWRAFTVAPGRMVWKLSIDLSRPLVTSMGHHDPLDGFVTCAQLRATAAALPGRRTGPALDDALASFADMIEGRDWETSDPLGIGGLFADAARVAQLAARGAMPGGDALLRTLLDAALRSLDRLERSGELHMPAYMRLPFRELGLSIGLRAGELVDALAEVRRWLPLAAELETTWLRERGRSGWDEHRDINDVMLATSLVPAGFLLLR